MRVLFVHQNFPGQYRHLAPSLAAAGHQVVGLGEEPNVRRQMGLTPGVRLLGYRMPVPDNSAPPDPVLQPLNAALRRARVVAKAAAEIRERGFVPDVICSHIGWGEGIFLKDVFPNARQLLFCEYFYGNQGSDYGFDPEFPPRPDGRMKLRVMNAPLLLALEASDRGIAPTRWQWQQFPAGYRGRISVAHDGIDTGRVAPDPEARFQIPGTEIILTRKDPVVTYMARNFEPYRGIHIFMRAIPEIQKRCPEAHIVLVGNDQISYSAKLPPGQTYRQRAINEVGARIDWTRVHISPGLPYERYLALLQVSSAHVYLTYPFVLSWSMLEAMAAGCLVIASRTAPVQEVIRDGENGLLVDFFSPVEIAARVEEALAEPRKWDEVRARARADVVAGYDLRTRCLPAHVALVQELAAPAEVSVPRP
ncbi:MAG: glycosyl transferase family 1 [Betaproteobacteria bacterium RIFCSPLOWO2_12_FULL_65_14]|nr:MAG: glycosyl transferase family 1 [Betaproteobacteria bacterium RIFCSPLOWO2_12_FULL_65_14]